MQIYIETKNIEITPKFYRYIESRINTLLESYLSDIKALKIVLCKEKYSTQNKVVCQIVMDGTSDSSLQAKYSAKEITLALETAIQQLRIKLSDKVNKLYTVAI